MRISDWSSDVCSSDLSSAIASCATPASASSTPIAASASTPSRKLFMADVLRFRNDDPIEEPAVTLDAFVDQEDASAVRIERSEEHTSELQSLMRISYAVFCLKKKIKKTTNRPKLVTQRHTNTKIIITYE